MADYGTSFPAPQRHHAEPDVGQQSDDFSGQPGCAAWREAQHPGEPKNRDQQPAREFSSLLFHIVLAKSRAEVAYAAARLAQRFVRNKKHRASFSGIQTMGGICHEPIAR